MKNGFDHFTCYQEYIESCKKTQNFLRENNSIQGKMDRMVLQDVSKLQANHSHQVLFHPPFHRDPRAVLFSQSTVFRKFDWKTEVSDFSKRHCDMLSEDIQAGETLTRLFPGRVLGIRYEDGALYPLRYAEKIYRYLGLEYDEDVVEYIKTLTNEKEDQWYDAYSIEKRNSTKAMNRWRYLAGFNSVNKTEEICGHLLRRLGYRFVQSQKDLESDRLLVDTPEPGGIIR
ncbi:hypothetical protein Btru_020947 [Bulinus truncatus]|nr:hypothetical protein Btru_020947 [Bulinus truncatus]